jgi:Zn-dependent protease with chaperone function
VLALKGGRAIPPRFVVFSLVSLGVGICYALGTIGAWSRLREAHAAPEGNA